jgi:hypothetical protein
MFRKGQSGNPNGKPKGVLSKKTKEQMTRSQQLIELIEAHPKWKTILDDMSPKEMREWHSELMEYREAKLSRVEHDHGEGQKTIILVQHSAAPKKLENTQDTTDFKILPNE